MTRDTQTIERMVARLDRRFNSLSADVVGYKAEAQAIRGKLAEVIDSLNVALQGLYDIQKIEEGI